MSDRPVVNVYAAAGVDRDAANLAKEKIAEMARSTFGPQVLTGIGFFGGFYEFKGYKEPVLVSSVDGVGTKLKIAVALKKHDTVGIDIVNHCINDILCCGAAPLFFLDYIASGKLDPEQVVAVVSGLVKACREAGCALVGGETAEMPGLYSGSDYDLAGFIIGVVEKSGIITGAGIAPGDIALGLLSSGLHTNGYSLVRRIFGEDPAALNTHYPELGKTLGEELLAPHRSYLHELKPLLSGIKGLAHITGGGLLENVPRILPHGLAVEFRSQRWKVPAIFRLIQERGSIARGEMYRVFNMGIGMVVICAPENVAPIMKSLPEARIIGEVVRQLGEPRVIIS